jgi:hypothetical protein
VEHPFRYIKQVFGYSKVPYRGLAKNSNRLHLLAAFSNLLMGEKYLLAYGQCALIPLKRRETGRKRINQGDSHAKIAFEWLFSELKSDSAGNRALIRLS